MGNTTGMNVEVQGGIEESVTVKVRNYKSLDQRAESMALRAVTGLYREQAGLSDRGAIGREHFKAFADFSESILPETKASILAELEAKKAAQKPRYVPTGKPRGNRTPNSTPGYVFTSHTTKRNKETGALELEMEFNDQNGKRVTQTVQVTPGKKNPDRLTVKVVE